MYNIHIRIYTYFCGTGSDRKLKAYREKLYLLLITIVGIFQQFYDSLHFLPSVLMNIYETLNCIELLEYYCNLSEVRQSINYRNIPAICYLICIG